MTMPHCPRHWVWGLAFGLLGLIVVAPPAWGQQVTPELEVSELHRRAVAAYNRMNMRQATRLLDQALSLAESELVEGDLLAQLHVTYGTILVLGLNRQTAGREHLLTGALASPIIRPDPMLTTPLLDEMWQEVRAVARRRLGVPGGGPRPGEPAAVHHTPVTEQRPNHDVPIYVEWSSEQPVDRALLSFRGPDTQHFITVEMEGHRDGVAASIPCRYVRVPQVEYFISLVNPQGEVITEQGGGQAPMVIAVRDELQGEPPRLPGEAPPESCNGPDDEEAQSAEQLAAGAPAILMYVELALGTGVGVPIADRVVNTCVIAGIGASDQIGISTALAWTELVIRPSFGFYLTPKLTLGVRGRLQVPGAAYSELPFTWAVMLQFRWHFFENSKLKVFTHLSAGYGRVRYHIAVGGTVDPNTGAQVSPQCGESYYYPGGEGLVEAGLGLLFPLHRNVAVGFELSLGAFFPNTAFQTDLVALLTTSF
jgi:hypothetical protein